MYTLKWKYFQYTVMYKKQGDILYSIYILLWNMLMFLVCIGMYMNFLEGGTKKWLTEDFWTWLVIWGEIKHVYHTFRLYCIDWSIQNVYAFISIFMKLYLSIVHMQSYIGYISFRGTRQWFDIFILYTVIYIDVFIRKRTR